MSDPLTQWLRPEVLLDELLTEHDRLVASIYEHDDEAPAERSAVVAPDDGLDERS
jgi:hypothetical protein